MAILAAMERAEAIHRALAQRGWHPIVGERICRLLDGREDPARLRCCGAGCTVCVLELRKVLAEVAQPRV